MLGAGLCAAALAGACRRSAAPPPRPAAVQVSGTIELTGLSAPVRVVRDRWGVPHLYAASQRDLFVAQGFVQAQERLFQMDLWRRSVQGRLSEVLGPNFIERDAMTRRVQYRGDLAREWAGYGADVRSIAEAFVEGVNQRVAAARERPPAEFVLAGWLPEPWSPEDLLNRTDGFDVRSAVDLVAEKEMAETVADAVRRIGAAPFFTLLSGPAGPPRESPAGAHPAAGDLELVSPLALLPSDPNAVTVDGTVLAVSESRRKYENPAPRFLIHLHAPGWNVAGATSPWRPGVAVGHNERFAWGLALSSERTADIFEQPADPAATRVVTDAIVVKGRQKPFEYPTAWTSDGVVIASDRERDRQFVLQWRGFEPGTAPELAALSLDRAATLDAFNDAAAQWRLPAARIVFLDREGQGEHPAQVAREPVGEQHGDVRTTHRALFTHPLAITAAARARFDVGPLARPDRDAQLRAEFDTREWDRSRIVNAPGESESVGRPHYADMAALWSTGGLAPFPFSDVAVEASSESVLMLVPRR